MIIIISFIYKEVDIQEQMFYNDFGGYYGTFYFTC